MNLAHVPREVKEIPLGLIDDPALPSRATMDETKLDELAASIRAVGLQQPLILTRTGERFEVIAGHRRTLACKRAGLAAALSIVYPSKDVALEAIKYAENRFREDLSPADEAIWFCELLERDYGGDTDKLAAALNERRDYVERRILLVHGDPHVFEQLQAGTIKVGVAEQLNKCTDELHRRYLLHHAITGGATVAIVKGWLQDWQNQQRIASGEPAPPVTAASIGAIPETNFFRCIVCEKDTDVHLMRPVNVHTHCRLAVLDELLATYHGR
jgi:ParB family chromosome partitioning protein